MPATNPASLPWLRSLVELMLEQLLRLVFPLLSVTRSLSLSLSCLTSLLLLAIFFLPRLVCWKWHVDFHVKAFLFAGLPACLPACLPGILSVNHVCMVFLAVFLSRPPSLSLPVYISLTLAVSSTAAGSITRRPSRRGWETKRDRDWRGERERAVGFLKSAAADHSVSFDWCNRAFGSNLAVRGSTVQLCEAITQHNDFLEESHPLTAYTVLLNYVR